MVQLRVIAARELSVSMTIEDTRVTNTGSMVALQQLFDLTVIGNRHVGFMVLTNDDIIEAAVGVLNKPYTSNTNINPALQ